MSFGMILERPARRQASSSAIALDTNRFGAYRAALSDRKPWEMASTNTSEATGSALQQTRFATPASLLVESIMNMTQLAKDAPAKYRVPTAETLAEAIQLLAILPAAVEMPEPVAEPSGAISYSWDRDAAFLALAVNGSGQVQVSHIFDGIEGVTRIKLTNPLSPDLLQLLSRFRVLHA